MIIRKETLYHILLVVLAFGFVATASGQLYPTNPVLIDDTPFQGQQPEIIAYQLVPSYDEFCHFEIKIIEAFAWLEFPKVQYEETKEIIEDRIVFEETNPWAVSEVFYIDDKPYFLVRVPFTGVDW
jgi:hypothetical protein|tara:strand:+ start:144 stop:521 length:378 start_codon:yes stop_codon:yes gene_type:complete